MKYYVLKHKDGGFWNGSSKLCHPPILMTGDINAAFTSRVRERMENERKRATNHDDFTVKEIDSTDHPRLAD